MTIFQSIKALKPLLKRRSRKFQTYTKRMPYVDDAIGHVAFVGSERHGFRGQGKVTPSLYFPKFEYAAWKERVSTFFYETPTQFMRSIQTHEGCGLVIILIYNEEWHKTVPEKYFIEFLEGRTNTLVYNHPSATAIMADKEATNRTLTEAGVDMPRIVKDSNSTIFSNERRGSARETVIASPGSTVESERYNTEYIDTRIKFEGQEYFVCLRAMCVGQLLLNIYVRCRPAPDGTPNVHSKNTPLNDKLLKYIYFEYVRPRHSEIHDICRRVGRILGQNFYAHDILLASSGRLPLCETGLKFDDRTIINHLWPISSDLEFMQDSFSYKMTEKAAEYTIQHAIEEGVFRNKMATKTSG